MSVGGYVYHAGLEGFSDWLTVPKQWLLLGNAGAFDETHSYVADVVELSTAVSYARQPFVGPATAPYNDPNYINLAHGGDAPDFGTLTAGDFVSGLVLARDSGDDATSLLLAFWPLGQSSAVGEILIDFVPWEDSASNPLPGGSASTRRMMVTYASRI